MFFFCLRKKKIRVDGWVERWVSLYFLFTQIEKTVQWTTLNQHWTSMLVYWAERTQGITLIDCYGLKGRELCALVFPLSAVREAVSGDFNQARSQTGEVTNNVRSSSLQVFKIDKNDAKIKQNWRTKMIKKVLPLFKICIKLKVVHNNCARGILLSAIVALKSIVSQRFSTEWRGLNRSVNRIKGEAATAASVKHKCYSLKSMMYYLKWVLVSLKGFNQFCLSILLYFGSLFVNIIFVDKIKY